MKKLSFFAALAALLLSLCLMQGDATAQGTATLLQFADVSTGSAVVKASGARLLSIHAANRNAASRYLQVFNSTGSTSTVYYQWLIPAGSQIELGTDFFTEIGWSFPTGLTVGISTSSGSYSAATAADHDFGGSYW